jgi:hypothetical protein
MTPSQAILELRALAKGVRRDHCLDDVADELVRLADRIEGLDPLPRKPRQSAIVSAGRRVVVQERRAAFGL